MHHGPCDRKPLHHAAGKSPSHLIAAIGKLEFFEQAVSSLIPFFRSQPEVRTMKNQNFARGQRKIQVGPLRHHSNQHLDRNLVLPDLIFANPSVAAGCAHSGRENANRGGFPRSIRSQQAKDFARIDLQRDAVQCGDLRLRLFLRTFRICADGKSASRAHRRRRAEYFAKLLRANSDRHGIKISAANMGTAALICPRIVGMLHEPAAL